MQNPTNIDDYIKNFSPAIKEKLDLIRRLIKKLSPSAREAIRYGMPTFVLGGNLVHFAAFKNHIGLYPTPSAITAFRKELSKYKTSKGAIQFPLEKPLPLGLIAKIIKFRVAENLKK
jgi:uncharacterized protein YdhG (YjbR/CyaY superfamily)